MTLTAPIRPDPAASAAYPLTEAQEGLWYAQALDPANPILNTGQYLDLRGPLDLPALRKALARTIAESEALHLRFHSGPDGPRQWLSSEGIAPRIVDLKTHPAPESEALAQMQADSRRALDLTADPLAAFTLFILSPERQLLYERIHHLAIDGYGMVLVTNRIAEHYAALTGAGPAPTPFPPYQRAHDEDAAWRASDRRAAAAAWWRSAMADLPEVAGPAPGRAVGGDRFIRESMWLPVDLAALLEDFSDRHRLGWPDVLTALAGAYLARWTGGECVIGLPFMARMGRRIARLPCMAMNVLPHRLRPDEDMPLADWLAAQARSFREARRHGLYRSEYLRRDLGLIGGSRRLYGPLVNVQPFDRPPVFPGLEVGLHILGAGAVDDLTLTFRGDPQAGILFEVDANPALYTPKDVAGHSARLAAFLSAALKAPSLAHVPTASPAEIAEAEAVNATGHPVPDTTLTALIEARIKASPDAPAISFGDRTISFAELDRRSAALAARLSALGAGPGRIVAVALERSLELPVALLAILRAGAAWLPLDPDHPPRRIAAILSRARPAAVLTSPELAGLFPGDAPLLSTTDWPLEGAAPATPPAPGDLAYVIFTSGSTGEPKGVMIEHRAIVNRLLWMAAQYGIDASDRILQKTPATFDVSVWEFILPMIVGAELVMAAPGAHRDPAAIAAAIRRHGITTLHFVPSMLSAFLASPASQGLALRRVFCSGEELTADQRARFHSRINAQLHNLYGPTEAAVDVSFWPAAPDDDSNPLPIGWPVWNTRLEVLDDRMRPLPPGLAGNLYLGGVQLARGYLGRDDLTAERFIPDPTRPGERLYATGDLARRRADGAVVYLGRDDHQVKIRGLRIELGEIEAAIMASGLARQAVVLAREDRAGDRRLVAYLVPAPGYAPGALAPRLAASLPAYMVPSAEIALDALPVTANGKLDRKALPAPEFRAAGRAAGTETERRLARLFAEILHLPEPAPAEADFFALGGDSLSAVRLALRIEEETGRDPGLGTIFEHPVLSALAQAIEAEAQDDGLGALILLADGDPGAPPLFLVHPAGGIGWGYRHLARRIAPARRVWGLQHPGLDPDTALPENLDALARDYVRHVVALLPQGPVHLAGWSVGGIIAQAMAVELAARGREAGLVALLDSYPADAWRDEPEPDPVAALRALLAIAGHDPDAHRDLDTRAKVVAFLRAAGTTLGALPEPVLDGVVRLVTDTNRLVRSHRHRPMAGRLTHFRAALDHKDRDLSAAMWRPYAAEIEVLEVPFLHSQMTSPEASALIAPELARRLEGY
ncbi:non-ribosomal peptide synthetase [Paracoccus siganidrum]|uniref:Amino acid adenylation domain-containing protein n=1 Tax=Paracoccus siganidrum TaxID=1276757 RepID=A0A419A5Z6_9RHOB|nr:non-ribosomal peptide synthetase [Paracoccus siganidrum]RJL11895.1 amino acid adenylation domain-containing protein [Paracoccus siganidrum]RMC35900.1 non-ribosomal peptide synthetase [Paracoccus siganidrum]